MSVLTFFDPAFMFQNQAGSTLWTPAEITTTLWLDVADNITFNPSSGGIIDWYDKSGNNRNSSQSTVASRPTLSGSTLTFDGTDDFLNGVAFAQPTFTWVCVFGGILNNSASFSFFGYRNDTTNYQWIYLDMSATGTIRAILRDDIDSAFAAETVNTYDDGNPHIVSVTYDGSTLNIWVDGQNNVSASGAKSANPPEFLIGARTNGTAVSQYLDGNLHEIFFTSSAASTADRQIYEGYAAHKWDAELGVTTLTSNLPSGHPYKSLPPTA
jgi:hypothetical protein